MSASPALTASIAPGSPTRPASAMSRPRRRQRHERGFGEPACGAEGDEFAVAVPREGVGADAETFEDAHAPRLIAPRAGCATSVARRDASWANFTSGANAGTG